MQFWFEEFHTLNTKMSIRVDKQLFSGSSEYQQIDVFHSPEFGRFLSSNGSVVFSEADEFVYDEMIVHVPMAVHPNVKKVLVIGGGDGGVARELSYYKEIESIDVVEEDKLFVEVCKEWFPDNACGLDDERVNIYYENGLRFLRSKKDFYDLIINDCTDPLGHTAGKVVRPFVGEFTESDQAQVPFGFLQRLGFRDAADQQGKCDIVDCAHPGQQIGILENDRPRVRFFAVCIDQFSGCRLEQTPENADQRAFSGAGRPDDAYELMSVELQADIAEYMQSAGL